MKNAEMNIVRFQTDDIMTTSGGGAPISVYDRDVYNVEFNLGDEASWFADTHAIFGVEKDGGYDRASTYVNGNILILNEVDDDGWWVHKSPDVDYHGEGIYMYNEQDEMFHLCTSTDHWHPFN